MSKKKKSNVDKVPFLTKKERKKLISLVSNVDWYDENEVWNVGVSLNTWSVKIRSEILRRSELKELGK